MKAKAYQIPTLKKDIQQSYKGALVYGPDFGAVMENAEIIAKYITPDLKDQFCVIKLTPAKIKENPSVILDEANAISLLGGRRLIWIKEATASCAEIIEDILPQIKSDTFVLMTADNLNKTDTLRVTAEDNPQFLTIGCYADSERDIQALISAYLQQNGYSWTPNALKILQEQLTENRLITYRELDKLMTYAGNNKKITEQDVNAILTFSGTTSADDLTMSVAGGRHFETDKIITHMLSSGETAVGIVRILINYFNKLLSGAYTFQTTKNMEQAQNKVTKFFGYKADVALQLRIWNIPALIHALTLLNETEKQLKSTGYPADTIATHTIFRLTEWANKQRKR